MSLLLGPHPALVGLSTFGLDTLFLKGFIYFIFTRCLKFFINIGKESSLSHTLGKGISSILRKKKQNKKLPYQCT